jgi:outer membrane lipoprotein SlyB|tara:strand:- start:745 stop:1155 length:411 start_codon:yes stop_codon:yes gene_type:complete
MKKLTYGLCAMMAMSSTAYAHDADVSDVNKSVINRVPYNVEVCTNVTSGGDKTGDTLKGGLIGGILGKVITKNNDGAAAGAVLGGIFGHNNSDATATTRRQCSVETRYEEERINVYSHSIVTFTHNGQQYRVQFTK